MATTIYSTSTILGTTGTEPRDIKVDIHGNVYTVNSGSKNVTKITPQGVSTIVGIVGDNPWRLTLDSSGNIYVINQDGYDVVRKLTPQGVLTTVGKVPTNSFAQGITIDSAGNIYTANYATNNVSKITPGGVSTILDIAGGQGPADIIIDSSGNIYTANRLSKNVSKITPQGVSTIIGGGGFSGPSRLIIDSFGNIYTAIQSSSYISKITPQGVSSIFAFTTSSNVQGLTIDSFGNIYALLSPGLSSSTNKIGVVNKITPNGVCTILNTTDINPLAITIDTSGNIYTSNSSKNVSKITPGEPPSLTVPDLMIRIPKNELVQSGLMLYLDAGNTSSYPGNGTLLTDLSGNNNHGTLVNGPTFDSGNGGSIVFDGYDDYVDCGTSNITPLSYSIGCCITLTSLVRQETFISKSDVINGINESSFILGYTGSNKKFTIGAKLTNGSYIVCESSFQPIINTIYHIYGTYDSSTFTYKLYINGVLDNTEVQLFGNSMSPNHRIRLGTSYETGTNPMKGNIYNAQIYNRALSLQEILQNYTATTITNSTTPTPTPTKTSGASPIQTSTPTPTPTVTPTKGGLVQSGLILNLDAGNPLSYSGTGTLWTDLTGNGYNGTFANPQTFDSEGGGSIVFNGINNRVTFGLIPTALRFTNNFTITIWLKFNSLLNPQTIISCNESGGYGIVANYLSPSQLETYFWINGSFTPTAGESMLNYNATSWYNITTTFNGNVINFYRNGNLIQSTPKVGNITHSILMPLLIGANPTLGSRTVERFFNGKISQVLQYNKSLSSQEVLQNYDATKGRYAKTAQSDCNITANGVEVPADYSTTTYGILYQSTCAEGEITDGITTGTTITKIGFEGDKNTITAIPKKGSIFKGWTTDITLASKSDSYGNPTTLSYSSSIVNNTTWYALFTKDCSSIDVPFCFNTNKDKLCSACEEQKIVYFDNKNNDYIDKGITINSYWYGSSTLETLITYSSISSINKIGWSFSTSSQESSGGGTFKEVQEGSYRTGLGNVCVNNLSKKTLVLGCQPSNLTTPYIVFLYRNGEKYQRFVRTGNSDITILTLNGNPNNSSNVYKLKYVSKGNITISFKINASTEYGISGCGGGYNYWSSWVYTNSTTSTLIPPDGFYTEIVNGVYSQYTTIYEIYNGLIIDKTYCGSDILSCDSQYDTSGIINSVKISCQSNTNGNYYRTWSAKNLDVTNYQNGDPIPLVTDPTEWANLTTGAYCYYNNDISNVKTYGLLYNWYATIDTRGLAPIGWKIPTMGDWNAMVYSCNPKLGGKLKEIGTTHWSFPNSGATNETGFTALPGGFRNTTYVQQGVTFGENKFTELSLKGFWWSSSSTQTVTAQSLQLSNTSDSLGISYVGKTSGMSVRLIKN